MKAGRTTTSQSVFWENKLAFGPTVTDVSARYFTDSWGISSETVEASERINLGHAWYIEPNGRFYHQTAANFYHSLSGRGPALPDYASSDTRLGRFDARHLWREDRFSAVRQQRIYLRGDYYSQTGDGHPADAVGQLRNQNLFAGVKATIVQSVTNGNSIERRQTVSRAGRDFLGTFRAMATPCEVRMETDDAAWRPGSRPGGRGRGARGSRTKFSRYRPDSVVGRINAAGGSRSKSTRRPPISSISRPTVSLSAAVCSTSPPASCGVSGSLTAQTGCRSRRRSKRCGLDRLGQGHVATAGTSPAGRHGNRLGRTGQGICGGLRYGRGARRHVRARSGQFRRRSAVSGPRADGARWNVAIASVDSDEAMAGHAGTAPAARWPPVAMRGGFL